MLRMVASRSLTRIISLVTDVVVGFLGLRIILKLLGASTNAPFVSWVYENTKSLLAPFQGMFPQADLAPRLTLEFSSIIAIVVYSVIGYFLVDVIRTIDLRSEDGVKVVKK